MSPSLAFYWGDDDLAAGRSVEQLVAAVGQEAGGPAGQWPVRGDRNIAAQQIGELQERVTTGALFGGGTVAVVTNLGALTVRNEDRDTLLGLLPLIASGNAVVFHESTPTGAKQPGQPRIVEAVRSLGGDVRQFTAPRAGQLSAWIEAEARERLMALAPGAARELASRVGGFVTEPDADRRNQTRAAVQELEKLALYRPAAAISADHVRDLVAEAMPGSVWAFTDAVGLRDAARSVELLERLLPTLPEQVLLAVLHRRIRELVEIADLLAARTPVNALGRALGMQPFRAEKLAVQARRWTMAELRAALEALLELDAVVKGAPGVAGSEAQRRLGFTLWIVESVGAAGPRGSVESAAAPA